ncbi:tripartite tricarboxylate transporter substrate binding protein [Acidovorax sp. 106]|uniref:Bug family tripartite tricarboxylate transporter substrate binding protein n=1 Tax=Acidovorax sp. 106 TaxID=2135637 RepID=UPI000EAC5F87|nr:tripartite tricarboxylate transporter substrate binding protein [Acidovorax sp. 106]RLJ38388.1 tripartite-type tricarboxylate transporter receptor subunit TctC [Acidovorax sp. 106]
MRVLLHPILSLCLLASAALASLAHADSYPTKPIRVVVHNTPGSALDIVARRVGARLADQWGQPVVVDNRAGAGGVIATDAVAKASPDGYTLLAGADGPITILPTLASSLPYDPRRDLVPVVSLGETDFLLVAHPKTGFKTVADFVRAAKTRPGQYNYASAGNGSPQHFAAELLKQQAGIYVTHIPYRGGPVGLADVVAGQVDVMFIAVGPALAHVQAGRLVALASGGEARHPLLPTVPTLSETYPGLRAGTWFGLFAPAATPPAVLEALGAEVAKVLADPRVRSDLAAQGIRATGYPQGRFTAFVSRESGKYATLVKSAGIRAE